MFGLLSVPRSQPPLRIALVKAFTHCDLQKEMPNPGIAFPDIYREQSKDEDCFRKGKHASMASFPLVRYRSEQRALTARGCRTACGWQWGCCHTLQQILLSILPWGSSESGSYKYRMKCHSLSSGLSVPTPWNSTFCVLPQRHAAQSGLWPWANLLCTH